MNTAIDFKALPYFKNKWIEITINDVIELCQTGYSYTVETKDGKWFLISKQPLIGA